MAISPTQVEFGDRNSPDIVYTSGSLNGVFSAGVVGGATDYRFVEVRNTSALTWTTPSAWFTIDTGGATVALAVADGTARAADYTYSISTADAAALTYSTPTTYTVGLALPTLAAGEKCLLVIRRTLSGAAAAYPENNILNVRGTSPA